MKRPPKKECQKLHALQRLRERYGIIASGKLLGQMVCKVQSNGSELIFRQTNRISIRKIDNLIFVYDNSRSAIVTFLTEEMLQQMLEKRNKTFCSSMEEPWSDKPQTQDRNLPEGPI